VTRPPSSPASDGPLAERLATRIRQDGPLAFSAFMDAALYAPDGFYESGGSAGRRGDFLTSPEVGPLFGAVIGRALETWWDELGCPDPYVVVDAGAGPGTLARSIRAAAPRCGSALWLVLVERAAAQRARHPSGVESRSDLPGRADVILANELLDNLPFDIVEHDGTQWREMLVGWRDGRFCEVVGRAVDLPFEGTRLPMPRAAAAWVSDARQRCQRLVVFDYTATAATIGPGWLRCYRGHASGLDPLEDPGSRDITADVLLDVLPAPRRTSDQAAFLRAHGLDDLVREGRQLWHDRAHVADLAALAARSRVAEAEALTDPSGLGGFTVAEWWTAP
jgi:SAM-dependent MidA family methyltransferase